jgi:asparagine synthase (glutamine-hydrolysing)
MYRYVPSPYAIWEGAKKLSPGHILIHEDGESTVEQYWDVEQFVATETPEEATAVEQLEEIVTEAVGLNLVSDVPLGVLLSGGVDSSLVAAMSTAADADPTAFSMGFDSDRFDELEHAHLVAEDNDLEHVEEMISSDDLSELLDDLLYYYDEPLGDSSIFPTYLLMDRTSDKLKTVVSGDGGDEVFAGYNWYDRYETYQRLDSIDWLLAGGYSALDAIPGGETSRYVRGVKHRLEPYTKDGFDRYRTVMARRFEDSEVESLLGDQYDGVTFDRDVVAENWTDDPETKDLQTLDMRSLMSEDILVKVDRASMAHSLEVRVPLLDHQIVEYAMSLDDDLLFRDGNPKHMLKRVAAKYLPDRIIDQPKRGFSAPLDELGFIEDNLHVLADSRAAQDGVFDGERLQTLAASDPESMTATDSAKLWLLILFEYWYRKWRLPESTEQAVAVSHED